MCGLCASFAVVGVHAFTFAVVTRGTLFYCCREWGACFAVMAGWGSLGPLVNDTTAEKGSG